MITLRRPKAMIYGKTHMYRYACIFLLFSANVFAYPLTYVFEGRVTSFDFYQNGEPAAFDPSAPIVRPDGSVIFNGSTAVAGQFTIDLEEMPVSWGCAEIPLSYMLSTQGAVYSREAGPTCMGGVTSTPEQLAWHLEGPGLTNTGGLESSIQNFLFNFEDGLFEDGRFTLDYMFDSELGLSGSVRGVISSLSMVPVVSVPEPKMVYLLIPAMLLLIRRRSGVASSIA